MSEEHLDKFEDKLCEGMTAFLLEKNLPNRGRDYMSWLNSIWKLLLNQPSTRALAIYTQASLVPYDRTYVLEQVVSRVTQEGLKTMGPSPQPAQVT